MYFTFQKWALTQLARLMDNANGQIKFLPIMYWYKFSCNNLMSEKEQKKNFGKLVYICVWSERKDTTKCF